MPLTMYSASVPVFVQMLTNIDTWLDKARAHAEAKKFDTSVYLAARLAPDMLPFPKQIQIASDTAKLCVARLAGVESPKFDDTESSLEELQARLRKTIDYLKSIPADKVIGSEEREVSLPRKDGPVIMKGEAYLQHFALPNFYFHATTAYALLRHLGVELGKMDYLGAPKA